MSTDKDVDRFLHKVETLDEFLDETKIDVAINKTNINSLNDKIDLIGRKSDDIKTELDGLSEKFNDLANHDFLRLTKDFDIKKIVSVIIGFVFLIVSSDVISFNFFGTRGSSIIKDAIEQLTN